jgi:hypothetical protein
MDCDQNQAKKRAPIWSGLLSRRKLLVVGGGIGLTWAVNEIAKPEQVDPLFFENWPDHNHCLQAALMIVLNTLGHTIRWSDVNEATEYQGHLYSWSIQGAAMLSKFIRGVKFYSNLDYNRFAAEGEAYLQSIWHPDWLEVQKGHASPGFIREQNAAKAFVAGNTFKLKKLSSTALFDALNENLIIPLAQVASLYPGRPSGGHFIVLYANDGDSAWIHDPGLPARRSLRLPKEQVYNAYNGDLILVPKADRRFGPVSSWAGVV